jgi:phospholipid/cholesterol/gamma-HCH transport system permease protein
MNTQVSPHPLPADTGIAVSRDDDFLTIALKGRVDRSTSAALIRSLSQIPPFPRTASASVNMQEVTQMDDFGSVVLMHITRLFDHPVRFDRVPAGMTRYVNPLRGRGQACTAASKDRPGWIEGLGGKTISILNDSRAMLTFVGDVLLSFVFLLRNPRRLRANDTLTHLQRVGADALPIVALISFLLGLIMAFMSAVQLEQFGANIYVASLVSLSMVRELGPIMTAIIVAGRSGSAFAAEIGSMRVAEEIDALTTMGFDITLFLVLPRLLATLIVLPMLTLFSDLFAVAGGLVVGVTMLDLTTHGYMVQTINTISLGDVAWSMFKTMLFAILIAGTGCFRGFQVRGGADAVGRATTSSVVTSIFLIILADSILAVIQRYWG